METTDDHRIMDLLYNAFVPGGELFGFIVFNWIWDNRYIHYYKIIIILFRNHLDLRNEFLHEAKIYTKSLHSNSNNNNNIIITTIIIIIIIVIKIIIIMNL